jgi:alpha-tubulin suppressor-like RCC1 family protein
MKETFKIKPEVAKTMSLFNKSKISNSENVNKAGSAQPHNLMVWGDNTCGQISNAPQGKFKEVAGGSINGLALHQNNTPVLWGSGPIGPPPVPVTLATKKFHAIAIGRDDVVLIYQNRTLEAFGKNVLVTAFPTGFYDAVAVAAQHAVAIAQDGTLIAWGNDTYSSSNGLLTGLLNAPAGGPFIAVDASVLYSLALHEDGTLYGWGHGSYGVNVFKNWTSTPEDQKIYYIPNRRFKAISAGNIHALAIESNGTVTGWGEGNGGATKAPSHVRFKSVAAGWGFSIGLSNDGTLWGWGTPTKNPFATESWTFASQGWTRHNNSQHFFIPNKRFKSIAAAAFHIMAITVGN